MARILLVDDDVQLNKYANMELSMNDHHVISCLCGKEALEALEAEKPDIIFLDLELPDYDGIDLLKEIKEQEKYSSIPIVILTGYEMKAIEKAAEKHGCDKFLNKPINYDQMDELIDELLNKADKKKAV